MRLWLSKEREKKKKSGSFDNDVYFEEKKRINLSINTINTHNSVYLNKIQTGLIYFSFEAYSSAQLDGE